jgi:hypothetical protein
MRNVGIFTCDGVELDALEAFLAERNAIVDETVTAQGLRSALLGSGDATAWVALDTSLSQAVFDANDLQSLRAELGFDPKSYVDVHFSSTDASLELAMTIAGEIAARWHGRIDYSGAGGSWEPPQRR